MQVIESLIDQKAHKRVLKLMGNRFEITVVSDNAAWAEKRIDDAVAEISRIEKLLTKYNENSQTAAINKMAGIEHVKVGQEVFDLTTSLGAVGASLAGDLFEEDDSISGGHDGDDHAFLFFTR